jgi:hypothetical protein
MRIAFVMHYRGYCDNLDTNQPLSSLGTALLWVMQRVVVISYQSFWMTEMSVRNYHYLHNNPEECSSQLRHGGSPKSHTLRIQSHSEQTCNMTSLGSISVNCSSVFLLEYQPDTYCSSKPQCCTEGSHQLNFKLQ